MLSSSLIYTAQSWPQLEVQHCVRERSLASAAHTRCQTQSCVPPKRRLAALGLQPVQAPKQMTS